MVNLAMSQHRELIKNWPITDSYYNQMRKFVQGMIKQASCFVTDITDKTGSSQLTENVVGANPS